MIVYLSCYDYKNVECDVSRESLEVVCLNVTF